MCIYDILIYVWWVYDMDLWMRIWYMIWIYDKYTINITGYGKGMDIGLWCRYMIWIYDMGYIYMLCEYMTWIYDMGSMIYIYIWIHDMDDVDVWYGSMFSMDKTNAWYEYIKCNRNLSQIRPEPANSMRQGSIQIATKLNPNSVPKGLPFQRASQENRPRKQGERRACTAAGPPCGHCVVLLFTSIRTQSETLFIREVEPAKARLSL